MPHTDINGQRINYEESGAGEDVIVFSHGLFMDHTMFDPQVHALEGEWRCITWDERGHGQTQTTDDPFTYWDSASDLLGLLDHVGAKRAVLAGMSQGGFISLRAALTAPDRVRGLILMDTQAGTEDPENLPGYNQLVAAWMAPDGPPQPVLDIVAGLILGPDWPGTPQWQERWRAMPKPKVQQNYDTLISRDDVTTRLGELSMPALVVHGEEDASISLELAHALADGLADARLVTVPHAGHAANLTHPEPVNAAIGEFLGRL
jgi:pimeloyl-ACP methyl ester carboxylesterase